MSEEQKIYIFNGKKCVALYNTSPEMSQISKGELVWVLKLLDIETDELVKRYEIPREHIYNSCRNKDGRLQITEEKLGAILESMLNP